VSPREPERAERAESAAPAAAPRDEVRGDEPQSDSRETRSRPARRPRRDDAVRADASTAVATREDFVKPVPEDEWMERKQAEEAAAPSASDAARNEPAREAAPRTERPGRRRRQRSAGTPTRLIGTGRKDPKKD